MVIERVYNKVWVLGEWLEVFFIIISLTMTLYNGVMYCEMHPFNTTVNVL